MTLSFHSNRVGMTALAFAAASLPAASHAQASATDVPAPGSAQVVMIVRVPTPWYAPRALVKSKMRDTIPQYAQLPGLQFKAFSFERDSGDFGGIYLWRDGASAQAWFSPAWFERVRKERGVEGQVRRFDALVTLDNVVGGTPADNDSTAVATLVEIPIPAGVTREQLAAGFAAAVPQYRQVPGLLRKYFTVSSNATFGGVYLWKDQASADAWFNDNWHRQVLKTYGQPAKMEWFNVPILLPTQAAAAVAAAPSLASAP